MWESNEDGIADLRVEALLGSGGTADVFRVCAADGERFAWKVLRSADSEHISRFMREGAAPRDVCHPNVVSVRGEAIIGTTRGLLLDLVEGPTLAEAISRSAMSEARVDHIARGLIRGVAAIHAKGLVHRDLTSNNVLLDADFEPHIIDFGLVKAVKSASWAADPEITGVRTMLGSAHYVPPEQARDAADVDQRADIYALGVLLYELVCGERPFEGTFLEILVRSAAGEFDPPSLVQPGVPARWERAILGAIRPDRDERWPDCAALMAAWTGVPHEVGPDAPECVVPAEALRATLRWSAAHTASAPAFVQRLDVLVDHHQQAGAVGLNRMLPPVVPRERAAVRVEPRPAEAVAPPAPIELTLDHALPIELPIDQVMPIELPLDRALPVELPAEARLHPPEPAALTPEPGNNDGLVPALLPETPEPTLVSFEPLTGRIHTAPPVPTWMTTAQPTEVGGPVLATSPSASPRVVPGTSALPILAGVLASLGLLGLLVVLAG